MFGASDYYNPARYPVETTLSMIGGRWKPLIIYNLRGEPLVCRPVAFKCSAMRVTSQGYHPYRSPFCRQPLATFETSKAFEFMPDKLLELTKYDISQQLVLRTNKLERSDFIIFAAIFLTSLFVYYLFILETKGAAATMSIGGVWFQSDGWRVFDDMVNRDAVHFRDSVHPLFSITMIPTTHALVSLFGIKYMTAIYMINAVMFAASNVFTYWITRLIGCFRVDSLLCCLLFSVSAASIFWFSVPETYPAGCVSILACLLVLAIAPRRKRYFAVAGALSLGTTVTNWMAGLVAAAMSRPLYQAALISSVSLALVLAGAMVARVVFPNPGSLFIFPAAAAGEAVYMAHSDSGTILDRVGGELLTPVIAPDHKFLYNQPTGEMVSFQSTIPGTIIGRDIRYTVALLALLYLVAVSVWRIAQAPDRFSISLGIVLLGQIVLHLIYGEETFLYSLHFAPLVVLLCAQVFRARSDNMARTAICILITFGAWNNIAVFRNIINLPFRGTAEFLYRLHI